MKRLLKVLASTVLAVSAVSVTPILAEDDAHEVTFYATVTDAGQYVDKMSVDLGEKVDPASVDNGTFEVHMSSTVDYGAAKGQAYAGVDASNPLEVVKTEVSDSTITIYFNESQAPTLTWLAEGRNYPGVLAFTIDQVKPIDLVKADGTKETLDDADYTSKASSWKDLVDDETAKFTNVQDEINYELYNGSNDALIVWFHGNGEGDFPTKDTNNNVAQMLANRGTVAWTTEEAQSVFGDATVMAFQAPSAWYTATTDGLLAKAYNEIQAVVKANNINPDKIYVSGCSAGGFMTTRMIIAYPDLFKAAMINCPALDIADVRGGAEGLTPTDAELATLKNSKTAIWLVQGETDSSVNPEACSKRIWNILTGEEYVTSSRHEGTAGIASGFTTYETLDNKYKLSLYDTVDQAEGTGTLGDTRMMGKLVFAEDYNQDGVLEEVKYNDHWSWIYTLRNNPVDADGTHIWQWAESYAKVDLAAVNGTSQKLVIVGDDWGPAVSKTIITLDKEVDADSLKAENFVVTEKKESTNWADFSVYTASAKRTILDVYLSDAEGNKIDAAKGSTLTIEIYVSPSEGSPFRYDVPSGSNKWCDPYELVVNGIAKTDGADIVVKADQTINLKDDSNYISPLAQSFDVTKSFTGSDGIVMPYGEFTPKKDNKKNALVIWLHGAGEGVGKAGNFGNDNYVDLLGNEVTAFAGDEFQNLFGGAYVITPQAQTMWMDGGDGSYQNGEKGSMYANTLWELIQDYVKNNDDVDRDRIIIGGCSNGGYMTMEMILKHPGYFYKAFPICEAYYDSNITDAQIDALAASRTGIWFTWADTDTTVNPEMCSKPTYARLVAAGADVHKSEWADVHDTTGRFWLDADGNLTSVNTGTPYVYAGHWSWIYFDNNENYCDLNKNENEWKWLAEDVIDTVRVYRLYNPQSGEHLYTSDRNEYTTLGELGWNKEGAKWNAPLKSAKKVYRLHNRVNGTHLYTTDKHEVSVLSAGDWNVDGTSFYSDTDKGVTINRLYNKLNGQHLLTPDLNEVRVLTSSGAWSIDDVVIYGISTLQ